MNWNEYQSRRRFLKFLGKSGVVASTLPAVGGLLSACSTGAGFTANAGGSRNVADSIKPIAPTAKDDFVLSESLQQKVLISWGDLLNEQNQRFGFNNDYLAFIPFDDDNPTDGVLWANHEYPDEFAISGYKVGTQKTLQQAHQEMDAIGGSLVRIRKKNNAETWEVVQNDSHNRRVSARTEIPFSWKGEKVSILGSKTAMGTLANCAGGITPWKTVLSCEENWNLYYGVRNPKTKEIIYDKDFDVQWSQFYKNPPEHYGWVVEINPLTGDAKKLVAMGRLKREGATVTTARDGRPVVYSGDDRNGGCVYKFIGDAKGSLETGTLYVADVKNGRWLPLDIRKSKKLASAYKTQLDLLIDAREASLLVGGSELDRPEDIEINPITKDIVVALTNNTSVGNYYGSLFRIREKNADPLSMSFESSTLLAGGPESGFVCPDNLEFDQNGNLWFTTDVSESKLGKKQYANFPSNGLYLVPLRGQDAGRALQVGSGPKGSELTGVFFSQDYQTLFISVQHPSNGSNWPNGGNSKPKPSVVQIYGEALAKVAKRPELGPVRVSLNLFS